MREQDFRDLVKSVRQAGRIRRGHGKPSPVHVVKPADDMAVIPGEYAMIAVRDNGAGMSKEILEHIFEPFFTTKDLGKGTGLGLATVYGIVRQNNGYIDVRSEPGEGTTFKIYLPRCENKTDEPTSEVKSRRISGGEETILLVEDSRPLLELGKRMLENLGYTVLPASTPRQAIDLVGRFGGDIQLLITDVVLPEMSGRELMARLSAARPNMRCLYMSGYTSGVIARQGVLEEGILFIQKPFSRADFAAKIRQAMN